MQSIKNLVCLIEVNEDLQRFINLGSQPNKKAT